MSTNLAPWQPSASLAALKLRADFYRLTRQFFFERDVLEVETPLLCHYSVTDVHIESFAVAVPGKKQPFYLQTSPEYAMKRLLAAGCGSIFQICKAFRESERGQWHNPEFTVLEWYRLNFDQNQLMDEIADFLAAVGKFARPQRITYHDLFLQELDIDIFDCHLPDLQHCLQVNQIQIDKVEQLDFDTLLQLLLSHLIEPNLGFKFPQFIVDFPANQAALAKIRPGNPPVAERFELYIRGIEIANGFHELQDSVQQEKRFLENQAIRQLSGQTRQAIDERFIAALEQGLPECSGVAFGVDRFLMLMAEEDRIDAVLSFAWERA